MQSRVAYLARPPVVVGSLGELAGPAAGTVTLPQRLMWCPDRTFDLGRPDELLWMYENVLREAAAPEELRRWINGRLLLRLWPVLNLPRAVRVAWEARHARLRVAA